MRIPIRTSRTARWSRRFGGFAVPICIIPVFLHRAGAINSDLFVMTTAIGLSFAVLAVLLGVFAFVLLWYSGDRGWGRAIWGVFFGLLCLGYPAYLYLARADGVVTPDIATRDGDDLALRRIAAMDSPATPEADMGLAENFPNIAGRRYALSPNEMFEIARSVIGEKGWEVVFESPPSLERRSGTINAAGVSLTGWPFEIAVHTDVSGGMSIVDVRAASDVFWTDFGANAQRAEDFLVTLDDAVTGFARENVLPFPIARPDGPEAVQDSE